MSDVPERREQPSLSERQVLGSTTRAKHMRLRGTRDYCDGITRRDMIPDRAGRPRYVLERRGLIEELI